MNSVKVDNILQLPNEILKMIFSFVPKHFKISKTCKKFYEISCSLSECQMHIGCGTTLMMTCEKFLQNDVIYASILNSKRRIRNVNIDSLEVSILQPVDRVAKIFQAFEYGIREVSMVDVILTIDVFSALNSLTNLIEISFFSVMFYEEIPKIFKFELKNLKKLSICDCNEKVLSVFDRLPNDVLEQLQISEIVREKNEKHLLNQHKITKITNSDDAVDLLNPSSMALETFGLIRGNVSKEMLVGQKKMTELEISEDLKTNDLLNICYELEALQKLTVGLSNYVDFSILRYAKNLKKLKICGENFNEESLRTIRNSSLQYLSVKDFNPEISERVIWSLSLNCANIRKIHLETGSTLTIINSILLHFPRLESLSVSFRGEFEPIELQTVNDFENQGLKELFIRDFELSEHLLKHIVTCRNLSRLVLDMDMTGEFLGEILTKQPNLKFLHFECFIQIDHEYIFALKICGRNLAAICFENLSDHKPAMKILKQELQVKFPEFEQKRNLFYRVVMKKSKNVNINEGAFELN